MTIIRNINKILPEIIDEIKERALKPRSTKARYKLKKRRMGMTQREMNEAYERAREANQRLGINPREYWAKKLRLNYKDAPLWANSQGKRNFGSKKVTLPKLKFMEGEGE